MSKLKIKPRAVEVQAPRINRGWFEMIAAMIAAIVNAIMALFGVATAAARGVGSVVGSVLPRRAPTPGEIAAQIASEDAAPTPVPAPAPMPAHALGALIAAHVSARISGDARQLASLDPMPANVQTWLDTMTRAELLALRRTPDRHIEAHVTGLSTLKVLPPMDRTMKPAANSNASVRERLAEVEAYLNASRPAPAPPFDMKRAMERAALRYAREERRKEREGDQTAFGMAL